MADIKSKEERSKNMAAIKGKDTKPELYIRKLLFNHGYRYRKNCKNIPGHPDIWMRKYNAVIFINGCFWHRHSGCKYAYMPKSRREFWQKKFEENIVRDNLIKQKLLERNIRCLIIWECTINHMKKEENELLSSIVSFLNSNNNFKEI